MKIFQGHRIPSALTGLAVTDTTFSKVKKTVSGVAVLKALRKLSVKLPWRHDKLNGRLDQAQIREPESVN